VERRGQLGRVGDTVLTPPDFGLGRGLRLEWEWAAQLTVVTIEIEARADRGDHELCELANPVASRALVAGLRSITPSDCLEVLWGAN